MDTESLLGVQFIIDRASLWLFIFRHARPGNHRGGGKAKIMNIHRRKILSSLGASPAPLAGSAEAADRKKAEREILQPATNQSAGFPSCVRAGRMTIPACGRQAYRIVSVSIDKWA